MQTIKKGITNLLTKRVSSNNNLLTETNHIESQFGGGLGANSTMANCNNLKINDRVNINLEFEIVQSLQVGHGGWSEAMFEVTGWLIFLGGLTQFI